MQSPKLSIITITFNNLSGLKETLRSVANLKFENYEHWIIDGDSSDGTNVFLDQYCGHPIKIKSEPDKGIYDAMNKGIEAAKGEWIIFLNAGDEFVNEDLAFDEILQLDADVVYGESQVIYESGFQRLMKSGKIHEIWKGMSFSHQAVICKTSLLKNNPFNTNLRYCADFEQLFKLYLKRKKFVHVPITLVKIKAGGISDLKRHKATSEVYRINRKLDPAFHKHFYFFGKITTGYFTSKLKLILPAKFTTYLLKKKHS